MFSLSLSLSGLTAIALALVLICRERGRRVPDVLARSVMGRLPRQSLGSMDQPRSFHRATSDPIQQRGKHLFFLFHYPFY